MLLLFLMMLYPPQVDFHCEVYGVMHEVEDASQADYIVYEESSESFADLIIYDHDNRLYADKPGIWHFVKSPRRARYRLFFTNNKDKAHFSVYFTDYESFAGCNR